MRTLGDTNWINDYIGIPYADLGRDHLGVDCYGLVKMVYHDVYGIDLPDWYGDPINLRVNDEKIRDVVTSGTFTEKDHPDEGDFAVCYRTKMAAHIGLFFAGGVIHSIVGSGVIFEPKHRFEERFVKVIYGEWQP